MKKANLSVVGRLAFVLKVEMFHYWHSAHLLSSYGVK